MQKSDLLIAAGIAIIGTVLVISTNLYIVFWYVPSLSCLIAALCTFLSEWRETHEQSRNEQGEQLRTRFNRETIRIIVALLIATGGFLIGSTSISLATYHAVLPIVFILGPIFQFAASFLTMWSIRFVLRKSK